MKSCKATCSLQTSSAPEVSMVQRRGLLLVAFLSNFGVSSQVFAGEPRTYTDERDNFSIAVPEGWSLSESSNIEGTGPTATKRTLAWFEVSNPFTYVTVVITNVGADYTSLGSFGTAEQFGSNLVASMDQSFLKRAPKWAKGTQFPQEARLLRARESDKMYNIEYTIKRNESDERHLLSTVALGYNGRYTRLYTVTAQCSEPEAQKEVGALQAILDSFKPPNLRV